MNELCPMPGCGVERITRDDPDFLHITAHGARPGGCCPDCGRASRAVHSRYRRRPADLPSLGRAVRVELRVRRFYCRNAACARRTFAERLPELLGPRARRTLRLAEAQGRVGAALGGEGGARLLQRLSMPASAGAVLRLVRGLPLPEPAPPRVVGVDDWALRKGRTYGTIVVDLERRRVLDLLPDRTAETLADWLRHQPPVAVVARDRSTEYARGIALGAPGAMQVADRWHLLANVRQVLERWLAGSHARLCRPPPGPGTPAAAQPGSRTGPFTRTRAETAARDGRRARRIALHEEVRRRHAAGAKLLAIGRAMGLAVGTVRKYAYAESFPVPETRPLRPSILDPYLARLEARLAEGCENGLALWRELRAAGFPGTAKQVHRWLAERRTAPARTTPHASRAGPTPAGPGRPPALPSPARLAWLLVQPPAGLSASDAAVVTRVEWDREAATVAGLARRFTALVRGRGAGGKVAADAALAELEAWLADARTSGVRAMETFAAGLEQDGTAVRSALTTSWSNGQAEGQITRLKLLKRQMYGRAGLDLLRHRALLAA
jgi:Transposase/zinc-finger of transposase IS204/IS1001/IS1096/IS1165